MEIVMQSLEDLKKMLEEAKDRVVLFCGIETAASETRILFGVTVSCAVEVTESVEPALVRYTEVIGEGHTDKDARKIEEKAKKRRDEIIEELKKEGFTVYRGLIG